MTERFSLILWGRESADNAVQTNTGAVSITGTSGFSDATDEWLGFRFQGVCIPRYSSIIVARLSLVPTSATLDEPKHTFYAEASDNASAFTTATNNISGRERTSASVVWDVADLGATGTSRHETTNLAALIEEVVGRSGWKQGNAIVLVCHGDADGKRDLQVRFWNFADKSQAPRLDIEYEPSESEALPGGGSGLAWQRTSPGPYGRPS